MRSYHAQRTPVHQGVAAWSAILGPQPPARVLGEKITADVVIVGGGFAGLSAARRVLQLQPTARVVVLEAGRLAEGAAGRNSGFMIDLPHDLASDDYAGSGDDRAIIRLNRMAIAFAQAAVEEYDIDGNYFDPAGKVNGAVGAVAHANNKKYAAYLADLDEASEGLDRQQMKELTGSGYYQSGLYTPGTVMLQPAGYIRDFGAGLAKQATIYENSAVLGFERVGADWVLRTAKGRVTAARIILANNGHLESFGFAKRRLMHVFLFASMTPELDSDSLQKLGGASRWGVTPSDPMGTTMRRIDNGQGGNRIVTRTCAVLHPNMTPTAADVKWARQIQQRKFERRFPALAGLAMEYAWAGHLCLTLNGVSVMKQLEDGVFSACAQNGLGTARGTLTGIGAAELACGETSAITTYFGGTAEPKKLPPQPFQQIGANAVMRWKEWRARDE